MKRFFFFSSLTVLLSAGFVGQAQAQQPYEFYYYPNHYGNYGNYNNYNYSQQHSYYSPQTNNWANQYFTNPIAYTNSFPNYTSNLSSRQALRSGNSYYNTSPNEPPTLFRPYYSIGGRQSMLGANQSSIVPYATPNYYAPPTYIYNQTYRYAQR